MIDRIQRLSQRISPGVALLFLAPIFGELVSAHQSLFGFLNPLAFVLTALPYGFGAIVCRELVIRWGKGWFGLVLLGIAYGIYEEAIVARSIWDPGWAELGALSDYTYWRGFTWTYAEVLLHFHLTISIVSSVVVAELLYPDQRRAPWVSNRQLGLCFLGLALWIPPLWAFNPFVPPVGGFALAWLAIAALVYATWRLPAQVLPSRRGTATRAIWYGVAAAINMTLVFLAVFTLPEANPSWLPPWPVMFAAVAALDAATFWLILRWSGNGTAWDDRHKLALVIGLLAFFIVFDVLKDVTEGFGGSIFVAIGAVWGLRTLWISTQARYTDGDTVLEASTSR
ncbi:MAG TPA: hypothetical protein VMT24_07305 [Aggregatilineaceae bacterium]|nr:hypothetical protein [Aggregatilineaceae bacterium]